MKTPSYEEAIYMATIKRDRAKQAMSKIVERYGVIANAGVPGLDVLLDYFVNMVYAVELLMKVLADDWRVPNKSKFGHTVAEMYKEIFKKDHAKPDLMTLLREAIVDQKFIYEPSGTLADCVPAIEELWDELKVEYYRREFRKSQHLRKTVTMPKDFGAYLLKNVERFYMPKPARLDQRTKEQKIAMVEDEIGYLQKHLERLRAFGDDEPADMPKQSEEVQKAYLEKLDGLRSCMSWNFQQSTELVFETWTSRAVVSDFLG